MFAVKFRKTAPVTMSKHTAFRLLVGQLMVIVTSSSRAHGGAAALCALFMSSNMRPAGIE